MTDADDARAHADVCAHFSDFLQHVAVSVRLDNMLECHLLADQQA